MNKQVYNVNTVRVDGATTFADRDRAAFCSRYFSRSYQVAVAIFSVFSCKTIEYDIEH